MAGRSEKSSRGHGEGCAIEGQPIDPDSASFLFGVGCGVRSLPPMNDEKVPAGGHGQVLEWVIIPAAEREGDQLARNREGLRCASEGALRRCEDQDHRAVVSHVGLYDVPRFLRTPNGVFNTTEFGSPDNPQQLRAMLAYSPYHHVVNGTQYPAVLLLTGDNDGRVDPMNSRKFAARLQAATASPHPVLLRTTSAAGHGIGSALTEVVAAQTDVFAFLWRELGVGAVK